jgi:hypothetical protein
MTQFYSKKCGYTSIEVTVKDQKRTDYVTLKIGYVWRWGVPTSNRTTSYTPSSDCIHNLNHKNRKKKGHRKNM